MKNRARTGFTLVEIMIVVVILGILASIVVPQFTSATDEARENALAMNLFRVRHQLQVYKNQHNGDYPTLADFSDQMMKASNKTGDTAEPGTNGYPFGPYLQEIPVNPFTGGLSVGTGAVGSSDWYYDPATGEFMANDSAETAAF
ncbi:prepilin-type N-terminal cleavage/methylation domain-containing protein [Planctomycetota bacterium]|nr:prepilin-type N-terminal cleavage/methylation domain-containing protein [Planctomycetota bacterium]